MVLWDSWLRGEWSKAIGRTFWQAVIVIYCQLTPRCCVDRLSRHPKADKICGAANVRFVPKAVIPLARITTNSRASKQLRTFHRPTDWGVRRIFLEGALLEPDGPNRTNECSGGAVRYPFAFRSGPRLLPDRRFSFLRMPKHRSESTNQCNGQNDKPNSRMQVNAPMYVPIGGGHQPSA